MTRKLRPRNMTEREAKSATGERKGSVQDGGYGWVVLAACFMLSVHYSFAVCHFGIFLVEYMEHFDMRKSILIWIGALLMFFGFSLANISAVLIQKCGFRLFGCVCGILACLSLVVTAVAPNVIVLYLGNGIGASLSFANIYYLGTIANQSYFDKRRSLASGIVTSGICAGVFIWPFVCRLLIDEYGWRGAMATLGAIQLHTVVYSALLRPVKPRKTENTKEKVDMNLKVMKDSKKVDNLEGDSVGEENGAYEKPIRTIKPRNKMRRACASTINEMFGGLSQFPDLPLGFLAMAIIQSGFMTFYIMTPYRSKLMGLSKANGGIIISLFGAVNGVLRIGIGLLADRPWANTYFLMAMAGLCGGILSMASYTFTTFTHMALFAVFYGIPSATYMSLTTPLAREIVGLQYLSRAIGLLLVLIGFDHLLTLVIAGVMVDLTGDPGVNFLLFGAVQVIGGLIFIFLYIRQRKQRRRIPVPTECTVEIT